MTVVIWNGDNELTKFGDIQSVTGQGNLVVLTDKDGMIRYILTLCSWWTHLSVVD